jgi:hypothetical protein
MKTSNKKKVMQGLLKCRQVIFEKKEIQGGGFKFKLEAGRNLIFIKNQIMYYYKLVI